MPFLTPGEPDTNTKTKVKTETEKAVEEGVHVKAENAVKSLTSEQLLGDEFQNKSPLLKAASSLFTPIFIFLLLGTTFESKSSTLGVTTNL